MDSGTYAEADRITVHEQRGTTEIRLALSAGPAEITTAGPARLPRLEWPMLPGPQRPRRVIVNRQPWRLDRRDLERLAAMPGG